MTPDDTPREILDFFQNPANYDHEVDGIQHRQTHVSHLFFAGDYVYKVKKPVDMGFLDFTTLQKRRDAAVAELELNRRVAPDVYLDVVAVHRAEDGSLSFDASSRVEEVAVVMRRLPESGRLSAMVESGTADPQVLRELGALIAGFHARAESGPEIAKYGSLETVKRNWDENFEQTESFIGRTISREDWETTREEIERYLRAYADLFEQRVEEGWIRDCHGDLQTDDIFVDPESGTVSVLDCIEFNKRFRYSDTLADVAFLSMDLRYRGAPELARIVLDSYFEHSDDQRIESLLRFYESYRAYVRGKVRSFVLDQSGPDEEEKRAAAEESRRFFELAAADARRLRPRLVLVGGLMGTGKTTLSDALGRRAGVRVLHSDIVRKNLAGMDPDTDQKVPFGTGIYSEEWSDRTYRELVSGARRELDRGDSVILDASWSSPEHRRWAREAAARREALFVIVECAATDEELRNRLADPDRGPSDGRLEILEAQKSTYEAPASDEADRVFRVETGGDAGPLADDLHSQIFEPESGRAVRT